MFRPRERILFLKPDGTMQRVIGAAIAMAAARNPDRAAGTDSLDLLVAATADRHVARVLEELGLDPQAIAPHADGARGPTQEPGLTDDAKRVVEAAVGRAQIRRQGPTSIDLFVALVRTPAPARDVLLGLGLDEARLSMLVE